MLTTTSKAVSPAYARRLLRMPGENQIQRQIDAGAPNREAAIWQARVAFAEKCERWDRGEHYGAGNLSNRTLRDTPGATAHEQQAIRRARANQDFQRRHEEDCFLQRAFDKQPLLGKVA